MEVVAVEVDLEPDDGRMKGGVTENDCVEFHPQYDELKGKHVCLLRRAYPKDDLHPSDAHFIGWRAVVEDVRRGRGGSEVCLYGQWHQLNNPDATIRPVRQHAVWPQAEEVTPDEGEEIEPEGGQEGEEAEPNMEDAAQSSADEAVGEAGPSGLLSLEPLTSEQDAPFQAAFSRSLAAQQQEQQVQQQVQQAQQVKLAWVKHTIL